MALQLRHITSASEIPEVVACYFESFSSPPAGFTALVAPPIGSGPIADRDRVLNYSVRSWFAHSADPTSVWLKVVDTENQDRVVASMRWNIYTKDSLNDTTSKASAFWYDEGPRRRYTEMVLDILSNIRMRRFPHILIQTTFTHPDYRGCGAGHLLMEWGTRKADELGLEIFTEASPLGYQLYSKHGFRAQRIVDLTPPKQDDESDEEWILCRQLTKGFNCAVLKRPVNGDWADSQEYISPCGNLALNTWEGSDRVEALKGGTGV